MMKSFEEALFNGRLVKGIPRLVGKPGSFRLRLARDTLGVMVLKGGSMGLGFLISVLLARILGVKEFGLYAFAMSFLALLSTPAAFGFPQLLVREIAANRAKGEWGVVHGILRFSRRISLLASLGLALLAGLGVWLFSGSLSAESVMTLAVALLGLPILALVQLQGSALRGLNRILEGQAVQMLVRPVTFLLLFSGAWLVARELLSAPFALGLQVMAAGAALLAGGLLLHRYLRDQVPESSAIKSDPTWLRSALWLLLLTLLNLIPQHAGVLLLGIMRGPEEVGLYKVAYQAASLIPFGLMGVNTVIAPTLAQLYVSGEMRRLRLVVIGATVMGITFALPLVVLFIGAGTWFLQTVFGGSFLRSLTPLVILSLGQLLFVALGPAFLVLVMTGREGKAAYLTGLGATLNVILNVALIPQYGINGAAISTALSLSFMKTIGLISILNTMRKR